ncbi:MAG: nucleotide sugar epimerase, partial [Stellaceae bacterium]
LARVVNELTGNPTPIDFAPGREWDRSGKRFGAPEKAHRELGFVVAMPLREGLRRTIEWTRGNRDTICRCILQHARFLPQLRDAFK